MPEHPPADPAAPIRIATYNIHRAIGRDRRRDPERIVRVLAELDADVIALQEVESRHGDIDMLAYLARRSGLQAVAGPTLSTGLRDYGNAVLTRASLVEIERIDLSYHRREPRGALDLRLDCRGNALRVIATHLGLRPAERRAQIRTLLARLSRHDPTPTVLLGDLNEWFLWGRPLRWLHRHFEETPALATFPASRPLLALDRLWLKPRRRLLGLSVHASALAREASDHLPLLASIAAE